MMAIQKTIRVRGTRWEGIEKKAWEMSIKENRVIKPTDVADAIIWKGLKEITIEDVIEAMKNR